MKQYLAVISRGHLFFLRLGYVVEADMLYYFLSVKELLLTPARFSCQGQYITELKKNKKKKQASPGYNDRLPPTASPLIGRLEIFQKHKTTS